MADLIPLNSINPGWRGDIIPSAFEALVAWARDHRRPHDPFSLEAADIRLGVREGRRLTIGELAEKSQVTRPTLSRILNQKGYNTTTENLGRLCAFFNCRIEELVEYVPEQDAVRPQRAQ